MQALKEGVYDISKIQMDDDQNSVERKIDSFLDEESVSPVNLSQYLMDLHQHEQKSLWFENTPGTKSTQINAASDAKMKQTFSSKKLIE